MHIMEGYLPMNWSIFWWALTIIILIVGIWQLNKVVRKDREVLPLLAVSGAFIFVMSSLKLPSVTGSSSHPTGTGLSAIAFTPAITAVICAIVLAFQALFLAHGGLYTFGANCFSMGFFGPLLAWGTYSVLKKTSLNSYIAIFFAAFIADIGTYVMTSFQLALAFGMETLPGFLVIFAATQIPLAIVEGLIIVVAVKYIAKVKGDFLVKTKTLTEEQVAKMAA